MSRENERFEIVPQFLSDAEAELIGLAVSDADVHGPASLHVNELGRVGKSGARLLLVRVNGTGVPLVVKIDTVEKIAREFAALSQVRHRFPDNDSPTRKPATVTDDGVEKSALVYRDKSAVHPDTSEIVELKNLVFDRVDMRRALRGEGLKALQLVYAGLRFAQDPPVVEMCKVTTVLERYLRGGEDSKAVITAMLGAGAAELSPRYLGRPILNPNRVLTGLKRRARLPLRMGPIHGDLHPNNVIVNPRDGVHVIDFAWAEQKSILLVDYVLMECSLRFLEFPNAVDLSHQARVDKGLLRADGAERVGLVPSGPRSADYRRLLHMLAFIRRDALRVTVDQSTFAEYLAVQFCVLYGLMKYPDYNRPAVLQCLGLIGKELARLRIISPR